MKRKSILLSLNNHLPYDPTEGQPDLTLFTMGFQDGMNLSIKPISLNRHIDIIHRWTNLPYSARYWQMQGDKIQLYEHYREKLRGTECRVFLVYLENLPVAQVEVYQAISDEVSQFYEAGKNDYGIHLLMAPYRELLDASIRNIHGISCNVLFTFLSFLFSFASVHRIVAEPDKNNTAACGLALKTGFMFLKEITMSYKTANLYLYDKSAFQQKQINKA